MKQTFKLPLKAVCKHSVRYGRKVYSAQDPAMFTDAYVMKEALRAHFPTEQWPAEITLTVEAGT